MSSNNRTTLAEAKDMKRKGKQLYFVQTEYVKYPFMYVWASSSENAKQFAKDRPPKDYFDFPERPRKWDVIGEVKPVDQDKIEELDIFEKQHPEAE